MFKRIKNKKYLEKFLNSNEYRKIEDNLDHDRYSKSEETRQLAKMLTAKNKGVTAQEYAALSSMSNNDTIKEARIDDETSVDRAFQAQTTCAANIRKNAEISQKKWQESIRKKNQESAANQEASTALSISSSFEARVIANMYMASNQFKIPRRDYEHANEINNDDMVSLAKDIDFNTFRLYHEYWTNAEHFRQREEEKQNDTDYYLTNNSYGR